ncbi:MAG: adenylate/guanylate cyclase domain-containing protein [Aeromicrobium sp.]
MLESIIGLSVLLTLSLAGLIVWHVRLIRSRREVARLREVLRRQGRGLTRRERRAQRVKAVVVSAVDTATKVRDHGVSGLLMTSIDDLARWSQEDRNALVKLAGRDGSLSILFSDIEDSTNLNEKLGDKEWVQLLGSHDKLVRACVEAHGGHIVKSQGDGFMIAFRDAADAVRAGIEIQDALSEGGDRRLRKTPIRVRVGIHCGTAIERDGDLFGKNVAMAARVAAQAEGGEILVSDEIRAALRDVDDIVLVDGRDTELKGFPGVHRLWEVAVI